MSSDLKEDLVGVEHRPTSEEHRVDRRSSITFAIFGSVMMIAALILPLVSAEHEMRLGLTVLQVSLWTFFCASWLYQGFLLEKAGIGFGPSRQSGQELVSGIRWREIGVYLLVFGPLCFAYIYVTQLNTGYFGFNYVLLFILAGFATLIFPFWLALLYLVYQWGAWVVLAHFMWGGWWEVTDSVTMFAGFLFSSMMFYIFRRERRSRDRALALSTALDAANTKLRSYSRQVEELAATQERNRIAREIHDTLGHSLTVVNMQLETAKALIGTDGEKATAFLEKAQEVTRKGLADIRSSVASLRSSPLDGRPIGVALEALLANCEINGMSVRFEQRGEPVSLKPSAEAALFRSAQEALTNVRKHAEASRIEMELNFTSPDKVALSIFDNGKGCTEATGGFGLMGIRERVQLLAGDVSYSTSPGNGFRMSLSIPR